MFLLIATLLSYLSACDLANNHPVTEINPDCNYAGRCIDVAFLLWNICDCCAPASLDPNNWCVDLWLCDQDNPSNQCIEFSGNSCTEVEQYFFIGFGFRADETEDSAPPDVVCYTDAYEREVNGNLLPPSVYIDEQVQYVAAENGWPGIVDPSPVCDTCTPAYPCTIGTDKDLNVTSGFTYGFQVDFNEYYDMSCSTGGILYTNDQVVDCDANFDYGQLAYKVWQSVRGDFKNEDISFINAVNYLLWSDPDVSNDFLGLSWNNTQILAMGEELTKSTKENVYLTLAPTLKPTSNPTESPTTNPTSVPTKYPTPNPTATPTPQPTDAPTFSPTDMPTQIPTAECGPYSNNVEDLEFQGVGSNCRAGLNSSWPGGLSCASPYIVCLPQENTPATFGGQSYKSSTYRYSIDECLQECANDQRCLGVEFMADTASSLGDCNLIDDIPPEITSMVSGFNYDPSTPYANLDHSVTNGAALCFEKKDDCFPHFEANDLNEVMLNCYCPNNRKGFYTKRVKRTVNNSRFCGSDSEVDIRIQKAQANRMFHLCENWCLFNTDDPAAESWYWDPWQSCWREQYVGVGIHMSYCNRVIRSPDTIEFQFINHRSSLFCQNVFD